MLSILCLEIPRSTDANALEVTSKMSTNDRIPKFQPLICTSCEQPIRSSIFSKAEVLNDALSSIHSKEELICESCYRKKSQQKSNSLDSSYTKMHIHCILPEIAKSNTSQETGSCPRVAKLEDQDPPGNLFQFRSTGESSHGFKLRKSIGTLAEAKAKAMQGSRDLSLRTFEDIQSKCEEGGGGAGPSLQATLGVEEEEQADDKVPILLQYYFQKYPFGNVHMALRLGPLLIENGQPQYVIQNSSSDSKQVLMLQDQRWCGNQYP